MYLKKEWFQIQNKQMVAFFKWLLKKKKNCWCNSVLGKAKRKRRKKNKLNTTFSNAEKYKMIKKTSKQ